MAVAAHMMRRADKFIETVLDPTASSTGGISERLRGRNDERLAIARHAGRK
jgi:hypothetical protein